jgi:hypothetical protein
MNSSSAPKVRSPVLPSHVCAFRGRDVATVLLPPLAVAGLFAALMHGGAALGWFPPPRPALDVDRTILVHQAESSGAIHDAEVVLLGDSSCLMDVSARALGRHLGRAALNLGTLSFLDLEADALLLRRYAAANPGRVRDVVLLMHPETLRRPSLESWHGPFLRDVLAGRDVSLAAGRVGTFRAVAGLDLWEGRWLARILPRPLPGAFGRRYGFTRELEQFMERERGSVIEPENRPLRANTELRLAPRLQRESKTWREAVPAGARLIVGMTPIPDGLAGTNYMAQARDLLVQWQGWLGAEVALTNVPMALPDRYFSKPTHLNGDGAMLYTEHLAKAVRQATSEGVGKARR